MCLTSQEESVLKNMLKNFNRKKRGYIICVDDDRSLLDVLTQQLEGAFGKTHEIEGAESATEAVELIEELFQHDDAIDMVISDQVMPGMKGDQLLEFVHNKYPEVVTVMLTGQGGLSSAIHAINNAGLSKYLLKPWNSEDLKLTIRDLLEKAHLEKENERLFDELKVAYQHLKETQEQLIHSEKLAVVGTLTAGIAHEIRNQLTVLGYAEIIKMAVPGNDQIAQYVQNILGARDRILSIVEEIRQFAKNQKQEYEKEEASLSSVVETALNILSYDKKAKRRNLQRDIQASPLLQLNKDKIIQVLINLVRNAVHATTDEGKITVLVTQNQEYAIVKVIDDGCGISSEHLEKIWQPFFTTKGEGGTGLGLDICKRIVEGHGGHIACESALGSGTTFTIELPLDG